jgi:hypothetical protein
MLNGNVSNEAVLADFAENRGVLGKLGGSIFNNAMSILAISPS